MSDLAPLVLAFLRDKTVSDLQEENEKLRNQLTQCRAVEITGPNREPVYARAQFDSGQYAGNPNLWEVSFSESAQCPLSSLAVAEVHVGGVLLAKFSGNMNTSEGFLDLSENDYENGKAVNFCFMDGSGGLWLNVMVHGWPEALWRAAIDDDVNPESLLQHLTEVVAEQSPFAKVAKFDSVEFFSNTVRGAIQSLSLGEEVEREAETARQGHQFFSQILHRMRSAGNDEPAHVITIQANELHTALRMIGISDVCPHYESTIDLMIAAQARTGENFLRLVEQTYVVVMSNPDNE
jgi:hypothetical protein